MSEEEEVSINGERMMLEDHPREGAGPLKRLTEAEIAHILRGFSETAISSAQALRTDSSSATLEACLFGMLSFYLPPGAKPPESQPSGETLLRDDLGLDSLSMAEAMFKIEELFEIGMETAELAEVLTIADARRLVMEKLETPSANVPDE